MGECVAETCASLGGRHGGIVHCFLRSCTRVPRGDFSGVRRGNSCDFSSALLLCKGCRDGIPGRSMSGILRSSGVAAELVCAVLRAAEPFFKCRSETSHSRAGRKKK